MIERTLGCVTLICSPESEPLSRAILAFAVESNAYLARLFRVREPVAQKVYWLAKRDWKRPPLSYGFPYTGGADAYLPAADVDLPTQLALIADAMDIARGGPAVDAVGSLLGLPRGVPPTEVYLRLKESKDFFLIYTAFFILPHELTHGYCNVLGYPPRPRWFYEGLAQWAAYHALRELRSASEAELIYAYYQLLWDRGRPHLEVTDFGRADELGAEGLSTPNYAWYHGGLLRMFRTLEEMSGRNPLPELVSAVAEAHGGRRAMSNHEMIGVISAVVGRDLNPWFAREWGIE